MPVSHFSRSGQQFQHVGAALGHHGQFGQVGPSPLHLHHAGDELRARRRFAEIVAGTDHCRPGGVGVRNQLRQVCARSKKFNVDQVGAIGVQNRVEKAEIFFVGQLYIAAFGFGAEGEKKQFVLQSNAQLRGAAGNGSKVFCAFKAIDAPFHTIGA